MTLVNSLDLAAWTLSGGDEVITQTVFRMDGASYSHLLDWTRAKTGREKEPAVAVLRGLHEIISLFVPDTTYVTIKGGGLAIHFMGDVGASHDRRARVRFALSTWLGVLYPDRPIARRAEVADSALRDGNWSLVEVSTVLRGRGPGVCDAPMNPLLWDAVTARVVAALAGKEVTFASGRTKRLIPTVPTAGPFGGIELVAFPPNASAKKSGGHWTEVVTINTASFPERDGIQLLAHMSIRSWGEVRSGTSGRMTRSLDVFLPQVPDLEDLGPQRHGSFGLKVDATGVPGARSWLGKWEHRDEENVFGVLSRLTGIQGLPEGGPLSPYVSGDGVWVMPRLGTVHGDRFLPGGTGLPMPDELALAEAVGRHVEQLGLRRVPPIERRRFKGSRIDAPFAQGPDGDDLAARRAAVVRALRVVNKLNDDAPAVLDLYLFAVRDESLDLLQDAVSKVLGAPSAVDGNLVSWADGLAVRLHPLAAGPLAESLFPFQEPTEEDRARFPADSQWKAERKRRQDDANRRSREAMVQKARSSRNGVQGTCCAVLEIPAELQGKYHDPYIMARQTLAANGYLPQVCLAKEPQDEEEGDDAAHRFISAFGDLLRTLGVVPTADGEIPRVAALTAAQVNGSIRAGSRIESQAVPMATQVRQGTLFVALPAADGLPRWQPYAEAYLALTAGGHERFDRRRTADSQTKFSVFWMQAIQDIAGSGGGLILIDAVTGRERLGGLANGAMAFDRLEIGGGNMTLTPGDLPGVSMARITHQDAKLPSYFHAEDAGWISGVFSWSDSTRTAFGLKQKPSTQQTRKAIVTTSRHMEPEPGSKGVPVHEDRKYAGIDETCAFFLQEGEDPTAVIHRVQALRAVHAQYGGHTSLPYPLHELSLLKNAITS